MAFPALRSGASIRPGKAEFPLLQGHHLFFHRVPHEEPCHDHLVLLTDPMRPVRCLILHSRVPPGIEVKHIRSPGKIETLPSGLQTEKKDRGVSHAWNSSTISFLLITGVEPSSLKIRNSLALSSLSTRSRKEVNCEKTREL